jgi:SAM-dependent methyltransferase
MINNTREYIQMSRVERSHWWYRSLHDLVLKTLKDEFDTKEISILDAGCGTGGLLEYLKEHEYKKLKGFDISKQAVNIAKSKEIDVKHGDLKEYKGKSKTYDVIISNDTMYFFKLKNKKEILNEFNKSLKDGGIVILNLPSFDLFKGTHDEAVGIQQRFNKRMVFDMIDKSIYEVVREIYWPFLLSPIIFFIRIFQRISMAFDKNREIKSDLNDPIDLANRVLFKIVRFENNFFSSKPFGSSLFIVLRKVNK